MPPEADALGDYLGPGEPVIAEAAATCSEHQFGGPVSVALTDRRLLCLSDDGEVLTVGYDSVCAMRSRRRSTRTLRGLDYRLLLVGGVLLATPGLILVLSFARTALSLSLSLLTVAGLVSTEWLWRRTGAVETVLPALLRDGGLAFDGSTQAQRMDTASLDSAWVVPLGSSLVAVGSLAGLVAVTPGLSVLGGLVLLVGGLGVLDYAYRHRTELDGVEVVRTETQEVTLRMLDGRSIRFRSDPSEQLCRELSRSVFVRDADPTPPSVSSR